MIVVACGAQMSKTEGVFNCMAHRLDQGPYSPILYIGPTEKFVKSIASDRWQKLLRTTPRLWAKTGKGQLNKTVEQFIGGIRCGWAWAGSPAEVAGHPAGLVMIDERSRMGSDVGTEGDPVSLARARTKNFPTRKIGVFSTPTLEGADPTWSLLEDGTMRFWSWACIHCNEQFVPRLELLKWDSKKPVAEAMRSARVACPECGGLHDTRDRVAMNKAGRYIPHRLLAETERAPPAAVFGKYLAIDEAPENPCESFWISGLASPWASFEDIAGVLYSAYRSKSDEKIQAEINTWGGELFKVKGSAPEWETVLSCRRDYARGAVAGPVEFLVLGADVQKNGIYYVVRGFGEHSQSYLIDHGFLPGQTAFDDVWLSLADVIVASYGDMRIRRAFIDSGYKPTLDDEIPPDHAVYSFCRRFPGVAFPTKGQQKQQTPVKHTLLDYSRGGVAIKGGVKLFNLDTGYFKRWIHARIEWPEDEPGGFFLHRDISEDYCKQLTAEEMIIKPSGLIVWKKIRRDNHYLDCEVGAIAAATVEGVDRLATVTPRHRKPINEKPVSLAKRRNSFSRRPLI